MNRHKVDGAQFTTVNPTCAQSSGVEYSTANEVFKCTLHALRFKQWNQSQKDCLDDLKYSEPQACWWKNLKCSLISWITLWYKDKDVKLQNWSKGSIEGRQWTSQFILEIYHTKHKKCQCFYYVQTLLSKRQIVWNNLKSISFWTSLNSAKLRFSKYCFIFCSVSGNCQINYCPSPSLRLYLSLNSCTYIIVCRGNFITEIWNKWDILEYKHFRSVLNSLQVFIHSRETHLTLTISAQPKASTRNSETWALLVYSYIIMFSFEHYNTAPEIICCSLVTCI